MAVFSWGIDAETLGSLMMLASASERQLAQVGEIVLDALVPGEKSGEAGGMRRREMSRV